MKTGNFINHLMNLMEVREPKRDEIIENLSLAPIMNKRIGRLTKRQLGRVFLSILEMKPFAFYLFNDAGRKMHLDIAVKLVDKMNELYSADGTVLFIHSGVHILDHRMKKPYAGDLYQWDHLVISMADAVAMQKEAKEGDVTGND